MLYPVAGTAALRKIAHDLGATNEGKTAASEPTRLMGVKHTTKEFSEFSVNVLETSLCTLLFELQIGLKTL